MPLAKPGHPRAELLVRQCRRTVLHSRDVDTQPNSEAVKIASWHAFGVARPDQRRLVARDGPLLRVGIRYELVRESIEIDLRNAPGKYDVVSIPVGNKIDGSLHRGDRLSRGPLLLAILARYRAAKHDR